MFSWNASCYQRYLALHCGKWHRIADAWRCGSVPPRSASARSCAQIHPTTRLNLNLPSLTTHLIVKGTLEEQVRSSAPPPSRPAPIPLSLAFQVGIRFFRMFGRRANAPFASTSSVSNVTNYNNANPAAAGQHGGHSTTFAAGTFAAGIPSPAHTTPGSAGIAGPPLSSFSSSAFSSSGAFSAGSSYGGMSTPGSKPGMSPFSNSGGGGGGGAGTRFGGWGLGLGHGAGGVRGGGLGLGLGRAAAADRTLAGANALAPLPQEVRGAGVGYLIIDEYQARCSLYRPAERFTSTGWCACVDDEFSFFCFRPTVGSTFLTCHGFCSTTPVSDITSTRILPM